MTSKDKVEETVEHELDHIREKKINVLFDDFDKALNNAIEKQELNFLEIETAITMLHKKVEFEQFKSWLAFLTHEAEKELSDIPDKKPPGGVYT